MITTTVVIAATAATVVRARRKGVQWLDIASFPSQWFNWVVTGREFSEPFCAFVGYNVREGVPPVRFWRAICLIIDVGFWARECAHCAASLDRLENINRGGSKHP